MPGLEQVDGVSTADVSRLINLTEWRLYADETGDMESVAKNLSRLERLTVFFADLSHIRPFTRYSTRLKTIEVTYCSESGAKKAGKRTPGSIVFTRKIVFGNKMEGQKLEFGFGSNCAFFFAF